MSIFSGSNSSAGLSISIKADLNQGVINDIVNNEKFGYFVATTLAKAMDEFVPFRDGPLSKNIEFEPYVVRYNQPYAHYQYEGTSFNFNRSIHANATAHWDQAALNAKGTEIAQTLTDYLEKM